MERVMLGGINGLFKAELNQSVSCKNYIYIYVVCAMEEGRKTFYCLNCCTGECSIYLNFKVCILLLLLTV